jgi:2-polyprenyl-3-methyl-5-hydroxy-6-metoxy-1,4-benzoquinol methylase
MSSTKAFYDCYWDVGRVPAYQDPFTEERVKRFRQVSNRGLYVLDVGCGSGLGARLLAEMGDRVVGMDISHEAVIKARQEDRSGAYLQACCDTPLPFPTNCFDAVYSAEVIEHLLNPETMIRECSRILKPSGILFLTTPYHGLIKNLVLVAAAFDRHFDPTGAHVRFFTANSLRALLARNGFGVERFFYLGRFWPFWMDMAVYARKR